MTNISLLRHSLNNLLATTYLVFTAMNLPMLHTKAQNPLWNKRLGRFVAYLRLPFFALATPLILTGCADEPQSHVVIFAGSSMTNAMLEIETAFELNHPAIDLQLIFAGSQTLAMQINEGAHADIFISANLVQIQRINGFTEPTVLVENQLIAITTNSDFTTIADAINKASQILVAHQDVPAGQYTYNALNQLGIWETAQPKIVSYEHSVQAVLTKMVMGQADLGFVYRTDAINANEQVRMIEFPSDISTTTQTWIALNADSEINSPVATAYGYITESIDAQRIYTSLGFTVIKDAP